MDFAQLTDEEITQFLAQDLNPRMFAELVHRHQASVIQQCVRRVKDEEIAQDLSQEVWVRVLTKISQFRNEGQFAAWLATIVHNRCQDHLRQNKRLLHQEISQKIADTVEEELDTDQLSRPTVEILEELLGQVSGEEKLLLLLKYEQGWSIQSIQQSMQLSESAVKVRLYRTREKLQKLLNQYKNRQYDRQ